MKNRYNIVFFISAFLLETFFIQFTFLNGGGNIPLYMFIYFETFLLYFLAVYFIKRNFISFIVPPVLTKLLSKLTGIQGNLSVPAFIIFAGILFRFTLFPNELTTSPDAYRYIWEGKVIVNGYNPYTIEPLNPQLNSLHTEDFPSKINFPEKTAIYPPGAQVLFSAAYLISGDKFWGLKLLYLIAEIITMIFILKLLHFKGKNLNYLICYAWLPLPLMEFFVNSHLDVLGIAFFIMFIYFFEKGKYNISAVLFALSFLIKFLPVFALPLVIKKAGVKKTLIMGLIILPIVTAFYLPFISSDVNILSFLFLYLEKWEFNASVYYILKLLTGGGTARIICGLLFVFITGIISWRYKDFTKGAAGIFLAFTVFAATVYPWYLGWIAALNPFAGFLSAMSLFFTINFSNFTPLSPVWREYLLVLIIEYVPFFALLWLDMKKLKSSPEPFNEE